MDHYDLLGVPREADAETIKRVYRQLARTFHPDVNGDPDAAAHFRRITDAFLVLSDPDQRRRYDRTLRRRSAVGTESESEVSVRVMGLELGGLLGISIHTRVRPLFADELEPEERPLPARLLGSRGSRRPGPREQ